MSELRLLAVRMILSPNRCQRIQVIHYLSAAEVIRQILFTVIVQTVCRQNGLKVHQFHIIPNPRYLRVSVIIQRIAITEKRIALYEPHVTKRVQRVLFVKEISRIAVHQRLVMPKNHIATQNLRIGQTLFIKIERIGVYQIHHILSSRYTRQNNQQHQYVNNSLHLIMNPVRILKIAATPFLIDLNVYFFLLFQNPIVNKFLRQLSL